MINALILAALSVVPVYTNHNRVAGSVQTMTNIQAWASDVSQELSSKVDESQVNGIIASSNLCTVAAAQAMTNNATIVRGTRDENEGFWKIYVENADSASNATLAEDALTAHSVEWSNVESTPESIEGYGITDAYTKAEVNAMTNDTFVAATNAAKAYADGSFISNGGYGSGRIYWTNNGILTLLGLALNPSYLYAASLTLREGWGSIVTSEGNLKDYVPIAATNAVANADNLWNANNAKLTTRINDVSSPIATNAAEAVVGEVLDYALKNLTSAAVSLSSGQIGNVTLGEGTNTLALTLNFSAAEDRSGDCLLYLVNPTDVMLSIEPLATVTPVGIDLTQAVKAGTNLVMATRLKREGGKSVVLISTKEIK